jgi:hypothetical protein
VDQSTGREARAAENELVFRAVNEQILKMTDRFREQLSEIDVVCECSDPSCVGTIRIDASAFGAIDREAGRFIVLPGHEAEAVEQVVERKDKYLVVLKPIVAENP